MSREIRLTVDDETYEALQRRATTEHVPAEQYAAQVLRTDLTHARFIEGASAFIAEHAEGFEERFGSRPHGGLDAA
ncbi:hypothetical protein [Streptomyces sp. 891-h]|uniref:hypothetical protein n=1 Tax=Streptomyces sp. 891-h TaxID=2720714 RepID=UPI001FAA4492|nr:hypothetical protein [Streptomyces sp. 891-h]UNZ22315.1 hypothetical protein HC362_34685 [Streptomyces sp. 891-h]